jgi:hypothetical protein
MCKLGLILEKMMIKDNLTLGTQSTQVHECISKTLQSLQIGPKMKISTAFYY